MKRLLSLIMTFALLISLFSCGKYTSSYRAIGLVRSNTSHSCEASFYSLEGELVFKIKKTDSNQEGDIAYSVEVEEGEIRLYYDIFGVKEELAHVKAGEAVSQRGGYVEAGHTVYIIIEATQKSRGNISVELNHE